MESNFSDDSGIKLEINNRKIRGKFWNTWKLNNRFLSRFSMGQRSRFKEIRKCFELNEIKVQHTKNCGMQLKQCGQGNLHYITCLYKKRRVFPGGASGKEPGCQCKRCTRCRFDPWVGKIPWKRAWQPTPVFLPGKSHAQRSLEDYSPWVAKSWTEAT